MKIKRILSFILSSVILLSVFSGFNFSAIGAEIDDYAQSLIDQGFPKTYINQLVTLHQKYPQWEFVAFNTDLDWQEAVNGERSSQKGNAMHYKQLIEKVLSSKYYCNCSSCYKNGYYVVQEGSSWVSASEMAVKYYMDPRTSIDEKYIFQFESTSYDENQSVAGVEGILKGTWMFNANITYYDRNGTLCTYYDGNGQTVKYSSAIMQAAKDSGMSAYYLASKIVQEVGGSKPTAAGASGKYSGFPGIYNYYNIGAATGAYDGMNWAASGYYYNQANTKCNLRKGPSTSTSILASVPAGTYVTILNSVKGTTDSYIWHHVNVTLDGTLYDGYLRSDLVGDEYYRPWDNPYKTIYYGAKWIAEGFVKDYKIQKQIEKNEKDRETKKKKK